MSGSAWLGFFYLVIFFGGGAALFFYLVGKFGRRAALRQRERQIETAMRMGMVDGDLQTKVARRLINERRR